MTAFPPLQQPITLQGPAGALEAVTNMPKIKPIGVAIVCHPHPLHGGTMNNKVVTTAERACRESGFATVRFNYRGVGQSEGAFAQGVGEALDLLAVVSWVRTQLLEQPIVLVGFSFGAGVVLRAQDEVAPVALVTIAPAANHFDWGAVGAIACPWCLVMDRDDEIVPFSEVEKWLATREESPQLELFNESGHFFHGKLVTLRERLKDFLQGLST